MIASPCVIFGGFSPSSSWMVVGVRQVPGGSLELWRETPKSPVLLSSVYFDSFKHDAYKQTTTSTTDKHLLAAFLTCDIQVFFRDFVSFAVSTPAHTRPA